VTPTIIINSSAEGYTLTMKRLTRDNFADAIASLKRTVPSHLREYEPTSKQWFVSDAARTQLDRWLGHLFVSYGVEAEWITADDAGERARKPHTSAKVDPFATLHLLPTAPPEVVKAAYRALAHLHHPDKTTGDGARMRTIIAAYEQLSPAA
jgi:DnaJ-domain-containing protein 1